MVERAPIAMLWLIAGFVVWAVAFVVIYALQAIGCAYGWSPLVHRVVLAATLAAHLGVILWMIARAPRGPDRAFLADVSHYTLWAAFVATLFTYGPAFLVSACI